jgi:Uncharacterized protein containing caspase domain
MKYYFPLIVAILFGLLCETSHAQLLPGRRAVARQTPAPQAKPETPSPTSEVSTISPPAPQGKFRALLVVVQKYPSSIGKNLPNAWAEISHISDELKKLGYEKGDIVIVSDEKKPDSPLFSTSNNVLRELESLTRRTGKDDTLMVIVSSHGVSENGISYFLMPDHTRVSIKDIYATLQKSPSSKKLLLAEACRDSSTSKEFIKGMKQLKEIYPKGLTVFHACSEGERSWAINKLDPKFPLEEHSVFLHYLAKGLDEADYVVGGNNGDLTVSELYNYLENKVKNTVLDRANQNQRPETFSYDPSFVIGKRPIINPFLTVKVPMDSQLDISLDQLAESGNIAIRNSQKRLGMTFIESWYYMRRTSTMPTTKFPNLRAYADALVADHARGLLQSYWLEELTQIGDKCFSLSIELRNDPKSYLFRADMYRSLGLFVESLNDYNQANTDMNLYILFDKVIYSAPPEGIDTLALRQVSSISEVIDQNKNQDITWNANPIENTQKQQPAPPLQDDLDGRFERLLKKSMELVISSLPEVYQGDKRKQLEQNEREARNQWQRLTLEQKQKRLEEAEEQFLQMGRYLDQGTVYQGSEQAGAFTTEEFESQFARGTLADYHTGIIRGNSTIPTQADEDLIGEGVCRLVVQELRGRGNQVTWIRATVCDLGVESDVWIRAYDVFWSKELAENYWVSVGEHSSQFHSSYAAVQANLAALRAKLGTYEYVSTVLASIPFISISLPDIGGYVGLAYAIAREIVQERIAVRQGEINTMVNQNYHQNWWDAILKQEEKSFHAKHGTELIKQQ